MIETVQCKVRNDKIDSNEYFTNVNEKYYLCSKDCTDKINNKTL